MGKLKISDYRNNFPLPPHQLFIELSGEAIKFSCANKEIKLKTNDNLNYHRVETKIKFAIDTIYDCIEILDIQKFDLG